MTAYLFCDRESQGVQVLVPLVSEDGLTKGKIIKVVRPGEDFHGYGFEELMRLGNGKHELMERAETKAAS